LALDIVRRVIGEMDSADLVARATLQALTELRHEKNLRVIVHPSAVNRVSSALAGLTQGDPPVVTVESDPALGERACVVVTDFAVVDASIEVQLRAFEADLPPSERT
jgi:flagellar biosynthesis/type III secretory pathway protein FliH